MSAPTQDMDRRVEEFRAVREAIESSILPLATSVDGRTFSFQAGLDGLELQAGGYVMIEDREGSRLGQILSLELATEDATALEHEIANSEGTRTASRSNVRIRFARGSGAILEGDGRPFHDALARAATADELNGWVERTKVDRARLEVGELALAHGVPFALDAGGFGRHTFLCGQSGSGKTYSLGVVLEHLLAQTSLRIVILDPNSDYVRLGTVRPGVDEAQAEAYAEAARGVAVRSIGEGPQRLGMRVRHLDADQQAALLHLDPIADREEYAELAELVAQERSIDLDELRTSDRPEARRLALRAANLGVDRWSLWTGAGGPSLLDDLGAPDARCLVVDLGSLGSREEQTVVAGAVLRTLWHRRAQREPVLVVIDEAHNVCPQVPESRLSELATRDAIRIAGEGRKFGIYLLLATQRPDKLHVNVLSQCDNLLLMRMNSTADLAVVGDVFSFAPPGLLAGATAFQQGEAVAAGKIASHPARIRFGARVSEEGGADVPATWADVSP